MQALDGRLSALPHAEGPTDRRLGGRTLLVAVALLVVLWACGAEAACVRWQGRFDSDLGASSSVLLKIRRCAISPPGDPLPVCIGRYRCRGETCPARRGQLTLSPAGISFRTRGRRNGVTVGCDNFPGVIEPVDTVRMRYQCFKLGRDHFTVTDEGVLVIEIDAATFQRVIWSGGCGGSRLQEVPWQGG